RAGGSLADSDAARAPSARAPPPAPRCARPLDDGPCTRVAGPRDARALPVMAEPRVSVVAPTYRRRHALPGFVEPLREQDHHELEPKLVLGYMPNDWRSLPRGRRGIGYIYRRAYEQHCARFARDPDFILHGFWGGNFSMPRSEFLRVGIEGLDVKRGQDDREFGIR